jgi:hypothetical protein
LIAATESNDPAGLRREALWFMLVALAFIVLELAALGGWALVTRPFWLDEVSTYLVAGTQSLPESMRSLAAGADYNPPAAFFLYRAVGLLAGDLSPLTARLVASACVLGALTTVYLLLRDQFSPWPAAIGALAVWAQQVVMHAAFEARFYGPLLLASGCLLLVLLRRARGVATPASAVALALASMVVCTVHYFGILSWGMGVACVLVFAPGSRAATMRRLLPSVTGPLALAACIPLYLGQRASLTVPTWIPDLTLIGAARLLAIFFLTLPIAIALVCWALTKARAWRAGVRAERATGRPFALGPLLLLAQVAVPFTLVAFSLLVQPATEPRYWIAGALAAAPVVALVVSRGDTLIRWIATVGMVAASVKTMWGEADRAESFARRVRDDVRVVTELSGSGALVVARWSDTLYPVLHERPQLRSRTALLDSTPFDSTNRFYAIQRDLARVNRRLYGLPNLVTPADLGRLRSFYLMEPDGEAAPTSNEFPQHAIRRVGDRVFHMALRPPGNP